MKSFITDIVKKIKKDDAGVSAVRKIQEDAIKVVFPNFKADDKSDAYIDGYYNAMMGQKKTEQERGRKVDAIQKVKPDFDGTNKSDAYIDGFYNAINK